MSKTFAFQDGDWVIEANGQPKMIDGISKGGQDLVHALSHPYEAEEDYGFEWLSSTVPVLEAGASVGILKRDVQACVSRLRRTQRSLGSALDDTETITGIKRIEVTPENSGLLYQVQVSTGKIDRDEIRQAFIITNRHRYAERDR